MFQPSRLTDSSFAEKSSRKRSVAARYRGECIISEMKMFSIGLSGIGGSGVESEGEGGNSGDEGEN